MANIIAGLIACSPFGKWLSALLAEFAFGATAYGSRHPHDC
jgi:hypothetical protein